jgi:hypothetical protein
METYSAKDRFFKTVVWTDSMVAANWIAQKSLKMSSVFIRNRVIEIQESCSSFPFHIEFRHVSGIENSADLLTRDLTLKRYLKQKEFYLHGPSFLTDENKWPNTIIIRPNSNNITTTVIATETDNRTKLEPIFNIERFSNRHKILRITGYVLRFINNLKYYRTNKYNPKLDIPISQKIEGLNKNPNAFNKVSTNYWIKLIQQQMFPQELKTLSDLKEGKHVQDITNLQKDLKLFLDKQGIIRTMGRYRYAGKIPESARYPVLMPANNHFTKILAKECHVNSNHAGLTSTCNFLRKEVWIPKIRQLVNSTLKDCIYCKKYHAKAYQIPTTGPMIKEKDNYATPFETTAVDYAGPIKLKTHNGEYKKGIFYFSPAVILDLLAFIYVMTLLQPLF